MTKPPCYWNFNRPCQSSHAGLPSYRGGLLTDKFPIEIISASRAQCGGMRVGEHLYLGLGQGPSQCWAGLTLAAGSWRKDPCPKMADSDPSGSATLKDQHV